MGRRPKPNVWDQIEEGLFTPGRLGRTGLDHLSWAVEFAQKDRGAALAPGLAQNRCLEVGAFAAYAKTGSATTVLARRRPSAEQAKREEALRGEIKTLESRQPLTEDMRQAIKSKRKALADHLAQYPKGVVTPSVGGMHVVKKTLADLLSRIGNRQEVRYPRAERILRWDEFRGRYKADGKMMPGGRFVIVHLDTWVDLATAYFLDLVARFGHRLDRCAAIQATVRQRACGRWFVREVRAQRFCSKVCAKRQTMRESRAEPLVP